MTFKDDRVQAYWLKPGGSQWVPLEHATCMRDALKAAGHPPEWVSYPKEGHGFSNPKEGHGFSYPKEGHGFSYPKEGHGFSNPTVELDFARRLEAFLAKYLQP